MSQNDTILEHLQSATLTPIQALQEFGCFRLAARIDELRDQGYPISTTIIKSGKKRYAEYSLAAQ